MRKWPIKFNVFSHIQGHVKFEHCNTWTCPFKIRSKLINGNLLLFSVDSFSLSLSKSFVWDFMHLIHELPTSWNIVRMHHMFSRKTNSKISRILILKNQIKYFEKLDKLIVFDFSFQGNMRLAAQILKTNKFLANST